MKSLGGEPFSLEIVFKGRDSFLHPPLFLFHALVLLPIFLVVTIAAVFEMNAFRSSYFFFPLPE